MVRTRGQWRRLYEEMENRPLPAYETDSEQECEACEQAQGESDSYDFDNDSIFGGDAYTIPSLYRPNDRCKRHRKRDDSDYSEEVSSYRRRKPK